jgi:hypothetical protein
MLFFVALNAHESKSVVSVYTDLNGITYTKYEGEAHYSVNKHNIDKANPMLINNVKPGKNLLVDEGTIAIEMYDHSGMFAKNGGLTKDNANFLSVDPEMNSFAIIPNPSEDNINITFELLESANVEILLYEYTGEIARPLITQKFSIGTQNISIPTKGLTSDKYYVTFKANGKKITKMVYLK